MSKFLITLFLGWAGVHKFMEKKIGMGILYLCTLGLFGIGWMVDTVKALLPLLNTTNIYTSVENKSLKAIASRIRGSQEDTVFVTTSRLCPKCSIYNRRVFSLYGKYKQFPILPSYLYQKKCPQCNSSIGFCHYFPGINGNLPEDISFSNRPFIDSRTPEEIAHWNAGIEKSEFNNKVAQDYLWITKNLPEIAPKSISGYKRMISSNSSNYHKIKSAAAEKGYII